MFCDWWHCKTSKKKVLAKMFPDKKSVAAVCQWLITGYTSVCDESNVNALKHCSWHYYILFRIIIIIIIIIINLLLHLFLCCLLHFYNCINVYPHV